MPELTKAITKEIGCRPEGAPITAAAFLHLGNRPAVSRALRALAKGGVILRAAHGVYLAPVVSRFGRHAPHAHLFIHQLAAQSGEAIAFVVGKTIGLDTGRASADYIHLYHGNAALLTESLEVIQKASAVILSALDSKSKTTLSETPQLAEAS